MEDQAQLHNLLALSDEVFTFIKSLHVNQLRGIPSLWEIQTARQDVRSKLEAAPPAITDSELRRSFQTLAALEQRLYKIDKELLEVVADFLGVPVPQSEVEFQNFREEIKKHVRINRESKWLLTSPYEKLLKKAHNLFLRVEVVNGNFFWRVKQLTAPNAVDELGMSDYEPYLNAKAMRRGEKLGSRIKSASDDENIERGIRRLHKILQRQDLAESETALVYGKLCGKYEAVGDLQKAIEYATKAIEAGEPFGMPYFCRGRLYYEQQQWVNAKADLEVALAEALPLSEQVKAKQYLAEIAKQIISR
jgi:tetratricopeptide (TPR) repeat protein